MAIKIEKTFQVKEPLEVVWSFLRDPKKVAPCVPGAQITEQVDETHFKGSISVKVGPAVTDFKGEVEIVRLDPQARLMELLAKASDVRGKGNASVKMTGSLRALPEGGTEVVSISEVNVVGILAQMGGRMINEVSNVIFQKFSKNFQERLQQEVEQGNSEAAQSGSAKPISAVSVAFSALKAAITRSSDSEPEQDPQTKAE